jgi:RNA polymerase sigma-70 factor (ECF subfamily)
MAGRESSIEPGAEGQDGNAADAGSAREPIGLPKADRLSAVGGSVRRRIEKLMAVPSQEECELERLMSLARAGDSAAMGKLLEFYRNYLVLMARLQVGRRLQGKVDPADLVQETFLEAHRDFPRFRGNTEGELLAWMRQILTRNLANAIRRYFGTRARDLNLERELSRDFDESWRMLDGGLVAKQSSPSHQASRRERAVLLANALQRLPDDYRETIVLRHLEGLSFPDVARRMDRTEDSVKKLWARALARLRKALDSVLEDSA